MPAKKRKSKILKRIEKIQHAMWHILHGIFPSVRFFEKRVLTPDFDHIKTTKKNINREYPPHLWMNYKCAVRHLVEALYPFLEVKIK